MALRHRLEKLERKAPQSKVWPPIFIAWGDAPIERAMIPGSGLGWIVRGADESEDGFRQRVEEMVV